jgi:hypothetical protein
MGQQGQPQRDASAITILQNSLAAMGGVNGWSSVQDWICTGTTTSSNSQTSSNFIWTGAGVEFRFETDTGNTTNLFLSGHGTPARIVNGTVSPINYHVARANPPLYLPAAQLTQELNNSHLTVQYVGTVTVNDQSAIEVHVSDNSDAIGSLVTPHDWFFDPVSFLPLQVQFRLPTNENAADYLNGTFAFSQFQTVNGMTAPSQITLSIDNGAAKSFEVGSITFNSGVPQFTFDPPAGGGQ